MAVRSKSVSPSGRVRGFLPALVALLLSPKYHFAVLFVSSFSTKVLHLFSHRTSMPILLLLLYIPTFLLQDVFLIVLGRFLYRPKQKSFLGILRQVVGAALAYGTTSACSSWVSFYLETGGEVPWVAATSIAFDAQGIQVLLSGLKPALICGLLFLFEAWLITPWFYNFVDNFFHHLYVSLRFARRVPWIKSRSWAKDDQINEEELSFLGESPPLEPAPKEKPSWKLLLGVLTAAGVCITLQILRPTRPPFDHLSGTIPFTILGSILFNPANSEFCLAYPLEKVEFPYDDVFVVYEKEPENGLYPGWDPKASGCQSKSKVLDPNVDEGETNPPHDKRDAPPSHFSDPHPTYHGPEADMLSKLEELYSPSCDPLKVQNFDRNVIEPLESILKNKPPPIRNIVILTLESTRKDIFPFKKGSNAYKQIRKTYKDDSELAAIDQKLSELTPVAEILTGESSGFDIPAKKDEGSQSKWRSNLNDKMGGINVHQVNTGSTYSLKSWLVSHCGVEPLPVDFTEEAKGKIYQPCLPQILDLLNKQLDPSPAAGSTDSDKRSDGFDFLSSEWETILMQSVTEFYDSQEILDRHMGFRNIIEKTKLLDPTSKYFPPKLPAANYFGYPESELIPYMRDAFTEAKKNNRRLFLSHLTSSTHHPHHTPKSWGKDQSYISGFIEKDDIYDRYLNTIRFQDEWIGNIFDILEETDAIDETLVILLGDHGVSFNTPDKSHSNVDNGHVGNFRIPLLFLHPQMPRIQLDAKTTPIDIVPTIMDLLIQTGSVDTNATATLERLKQRYQGQSLLRDFIPSDGNGREPWHFGTINPGGSVIAISSASTKYRLVLPLCSIMEIRFTDTSSDPDEHDPTTEWTLDKLQKKVNERYGEEAEKWLVKAEKLGRWWFWEQHRRWDYHKATRSTDRGGADAGGGAVKKNAWWET